MVFKRALNLTLGLKKNRGAEESLPFPDASCNGLVMCVDTPQVTACVSAAMQTHLLGGPWKCFAADSRGGPISFARTLGGFPASRLLEGQKDALLFFPEPHHSVKPHKASGENCVNHRIQMCRDDSQMCLSGAQEQSWLFQGEQTASCTWHFPLQTTPSSGLQTK